MKFPKATKGLIVENLTDETLVFHPKTHQACSLKQPTACIFHLCNGERSPADLSRLASEELGMEISEDVASAALQTLSDEGLVEAGSTELSRRNFLKASVLVPAIVTLTAQGAAAH